MQKDRSPSNNILLKWNLIKSGQIEDEFEEFDDGNIFELSDFREAYNFKKLIFFST